MNIREIMEQKNNVESPAQNNKQKDGNINGIEKIANVKGNGKKRKAPKVR